MKNLIWFDGISGSGKETALEFAKKYLKNELKKEVHLFREPQHFREEILKLKNQKKVSDKAIFELLLKDRKISLQNYGRFIGKEGHVSLGDRSYIATKVYQAGEEITIKEIEEAHKFYPKADLALILLCDPEIAVDRIINYSQKYLN